MSDRYKELMDNIPGVFFRCACDEHWTMQHISAGIELLTGFSNTELVRNHKMSYASLIHELDTEKVEEDVLAAVDKRSSWNIEYRLRRKDGTYVWVSERGVGIYDDNGITQFLDGFVADISERKKLEQALQQSEEHVRRLAFYDSVTNLPNRNFILDKIQERTTSLGENENFGILYIDLDGFKSINDKHGHATGDNVLKITGKRMQDAATDTDIVARIGGDEFLVFCNRTIEEQHCISLAQDIVTSISKPFQLGSRICTIGASIGIKLSDPGVSTVDSLIAAADAAMYCAKTSGTNLVYLNNLNGLEKAA